MVPANMTETGPMSILDGLPTSAEDMQNAATLATPMIERALAAMNLSPLQRSIMDLVKKGHALADIYGLSQDERDAMFARGCQLLQSGEIEKARDWLLFVHLLNMHDARVIYVIAVTYQTQGNFSIAAKLYASFIALDPTNPEGHLRLGECLLSAREYQAALTSFQRAKNECARGNGAAEAAAHAARMLEHTLAKLAASNATKLVRNANSQRS